MVSQMHSLFNKVADNGHIELTYEIATQGEKDVGHNTDIGLTTS